MTIDIVGIILFLLGLILYYAVKGKHIIFLFVSGIGAGMVIAAVWVYFQIQSMDFSQFFR